MVNMHRDPESGRWFGTFECERGDDLGLRPCPFCGETEDFHVFGTSSNAHYFVRCATCGSEGHHDDVSPSIKVDARSRAAFEASHRRGLARGIAAWNRRPECDALRAIVDGRSTPPTREEARLLQWELGHWRFADSDGPGVVVEEGTCRSWEDVAAVIVRSAARGGSLRWWAFEGGGAPCPWPVEP